MKILVCIFTVIAVTMASGDLENAFKEHKVVPDVVSAAPAAALKVISFYLKIISN